MHLLKTMIEDWSHDRAQGPNQKEWTERDRGCIAGQGVGIQIIIPAFLNSCSQLYPIGR